MDSPVVTAAEMKAAEEAAFARGVTPEALMDEAAAGIARVVSAFFPDPGTCIVFGGKGNNAGDAFAAAALLREQGWKISIRDVFPQSELGELAAKKRTLIAESAQERNTAATASEPLIVLDGLLGLGAKPPLRDPIRGACSEINALRRERKAFVIAVDLPTGLDADSGEAAPEAVIADCTIAIGFAKRGLVADRALDRVGRLAVVPLLNLDPPSNGERDIVATPQALRHLLPRRPFGAYKNQFGRVGIIAGSRGLTGAALLCCSGALRAGAGLVNVFVREEIYPIIAAAAPWEAMVVPVKSFRDALDQDVTAWAVGPGLGQAHADEILSLLAEIREPVVVDADALNTIAAEPSALRRFGGPRLLTPHPGEMKRLLGDSDQHDGESRAEVARKFVSKHDVTLLLKGSRTIVARRNRPLSYNTTGHPGMATGGMGDVLSGVLAALLAQGLAPYDAARLGAWLCGRSAEFALATGEQSEQSLLPRHVTEHLGRAFCEI